MCKTSDGVAQVVEQRTHKPLVGGSNPSTVIKPLFMFRILSHLVENHFPFNKLHDSF